MLRVETPGPGDVEFRVFDGAGDVGVGTLSSLGGSEGLTTLQVGASGPLNDGRHMAMAVLRAPEDFVRASTPADEIPGMRPIEVEARYRPTDATARRSIPLRLSWQNRITSGSAASTLSHSMSRQPPVTTLRPPARRSASPA